MEVAMGLSQDRLQNDERCVFDVTDDSSAQKVDVDVTTTCFDLSVVDLELKIDEKTPGKLRILD
jgi:hypothetical protein